MKVTDEMLRETLTKFMEEEIEKLEKEVENNPPPELSEEFKKKIDALLKEG